MERVKQILMAAQSEETEEPRTFAAFGGIMDTGTGRRGYGIGSFVKKAVKKGIKTVKKIAKSDIGKLALMYAAGTYLGGMEAFGGTGYAGGAPWTKFKTQLLNPMGKEGIANVGRKAMSYFQKPTSKVADATGQWIRKAPPGTTGIGAEVFREGVQKAAPSILPNISNKVLAGVALPSIAAGLYTAKQPPEELGGEVTAEYDDNKAWWDNYLANLDSDYSVNPARLKSAQGGRIGRQEGGLMDLGGMEKDYRQEGGFVPIGGKEKADDVPARLSKNEFVFTADAVRAAGGGDIDAGAEAMENVMQNLEAGGEISEESQGQGAQGMFEVSERLSEVM
jgi:hypothetical protein